MRIVELSDYTMTIMKDSDDPFWFTVSSMHEMAKNKSLNLFITSEEIGPMPKPHHSAIANDSLSSAGKLLLFSADKIDPSFKIGDKVYLYALPRN